MVIFGQNIKFFPFLAEFRCVEGRMIRYRYPCFNDFGYRIVGKYRYFRYIVYRYTSLVQDVVCKDSKLFCAFCLSCRFMIWGQTYFVRHYFFSSELWLFLYLHIFRSVVHLFITFSHYFYASHIIVIYTCKAMS